MFDTHAHLNLKPLESNLPAILDRCRILGISKIMIPGTSIASSRTALKLAEAHEQLYAAIGVHPSEITVHPSETADTNAEDDAQIIAELSQLAPLSTKIKAIGEIGLDRYAIHRKLGSFDEGLFQRQLNIFTAQFRLAKDLHKSVIIHNRQAKSDLIHMLEDNWDSYYANKVVIHCCEPDEQLLEFAVRHDIYIGVDGDVTYNEEKQIFVHKIPLDRLVIETDSPYLTPSPIRDNPATNYPNSPVNLPLIAQKIADIKDVEVNMIEKVTEENGKKLFDL